MIRAGIAVERDEQVGVVVVGDFRALAEFGVHIRFSRVYHLDIRAVIADQFAGSQRNGESHILLLGIRAEGAGVAAAVTCVDHHLERFPVFLGERGGHQKNYEQIY